MARNRKVLDPLRPVAVWSSTDLHRGEAVPSLTVILRTRGCSWNRCSMCSYALEGAPATSDDLTHQFRESMKRLTPDMRVVKLYTSGSFFDPVEVPSDGRRNILNELKSHPHIEKLIVESRPEYVTSELVDEAMSILDLEVGIGLETANDLIREHVILKGFKFSDFKNAASLLRSHGARVKCYLLLKPPLLSEGQAVKDAVSSAKIAKEHCDIISLNLCNVQRGSFVERLFERGEYRPPWLWSAVEVLQQIKTPIICDPVGAGSLRGPHNCGLCDSQVAQAIVHHATSQDVSVFDELNCSCKSTWEKVVELEEVAFATPLI